MYLPAWRVRVLPFLFPALLLLPTLHLHPALEHRDGTHGVHAHHSVVHTDFFPSSAHDHSEHHEGKSEPDDGSPRFRPQISFPAFLSRSVALACANPRTRPRRSGCAGVACLRLVLISYPGACTRPRASYPNLCLFPDLSPLSSAHRLGSCGLFAFFPKNLSPCDEVTNLRTIHISPAEWRNVRWRVDICAL